MGSDLKTRTIQWRDERNISSCLFESIFKFQKGPKEYNIYWLQYTYVMLQSTTLKTFHFTIYIFEIFYLILLHFIDRQTIVLWKANQCWIVPSTETVYFFLVLCWVMSSHHYLKRIQSRYTDGDKNEPERIYFKCLTFFYRYFNAFRIFFWYFFCLFF